MSASNPDPIKVLSWSRHVSGKYLMYLGTDEETGVMKFATASNFSDLCMKAKMCGFDFIAYYHYQKPL